MTAPRTASPDSPPSAGAGPAPELPKVLGVLDGLALTLSNISPTMSVGIGLGIIGSAVGLGIPAAFLLACLPILGIAVAYTRLNRVERNCGAAYVWVGRRIGPLPGYLIGWVIVSTNIIFIAYAVPLAGQYAFYALDAFGLHRLGGFDLGAAHPVSAFLVGVVITAGLTGLAVAGVDLAARFQRAFVTAEFAVVIVLCVLAVTKGRAASFSLSWFSPTVFSSPSVMATGVLLSVYMYWGWETAFSVTEENADARTSARVGMGSLVAVIGLFLFAAVAFQRALTPQELAAHGDNGLPFLGDLVAGRTGQAVATTTLLLSIVSCIQSVLIGTARQTLAMSRDGVMGTGWSRLHPRRGTPHIATVRTAVLAVVIAAVSIELGNVQEIVVGSVTAVGMLVSMYYALAGAACALTFRQEARTDPRTLVVAVLVPLLSGAVLLALGVYMAWSQWTSTDHFAFSASNGRFLTVLPLVILLIGLPLAAWNRYRRKAPYFTARALATTADPLDPRR
ncbi:APC family permease [Streptomyces carpinensis]|uniref:APC family permease n=1 Tax=Streptomyces carpinensis TaxID=66369 RepID=A0ABV1W9V4_9ACTN|nr:APC family permease [Streptomyces carpinensis]